MVLSVFISVSVNQLNYISLHLRKLSLESVTKKEIVDLRVTSLFQQQESSSYQFTFFQLFKFLEQQFL